MSRSKTSGKWLREHFDDVYVQRAKDEGWRSRAVYKLLEINDKDALIKPGMTVLDLGAAPGGWSQMAARSVGDHGLVIASFSLKTFRGQITCPGDPFFAFSKNKK